MTTLDYLFQGGLILLQLQWPVTIFSAFESVTKEQLSALARDILASILGYRPEQTIFVNSAEAQYLSVKCGLGIALISELSRNFCKEDMAYFNTGQTSQVVILSKAENENANLIDFFIHSVASQTREKK